MRFLLFDKDEQYLDRLKVVSKAIQPEEINGEDTLTLTTRDSIVDKSQRIVYKTELGYWKEYIVKGIDKTHNDRGIEYNLHCESSFYETLGDYIDDRRPENVTATAALLIALEPTRWEVGTVHDLGLKSTNFYRTTCKECVHKIAEVWGGEIRTRVTVSGNKITGRYVDLFAQRGNDNGVRFTYTKNLRTVTKTILRDDVVTALYGYGKGEYIEETGGWGRRIDFKDLNDGKAYVEDNEARLIWGRNDGDGEKVHVFGKIEFDDCEDPAELLDLTTAKLAEISQPQIAYDCTVLELGQVDLGDYVKVIDREFEPELRMNARVVRIERDLLEKERSIITFGNYRPDITDYLSQQQSYVSSFRDKAGIWDRANSFDGDGNLPTSFLDGVMDVTRNHLVASQSGWYTDDNGNLVFNALDGSSSMMLTGGGFMIANTKLPSGEWDYRTFGTGDGFLADYLIAGTLLGGKVKWNLSDGTLLIGDSVEDYVLFFDGGNLHIDLSGNQQITDLEEAIENIDFQEQFDEIDESITNLEATVQQQLSGVEATQQGYEDRLQEAEASSESMLEDLIDMSGRTEVVETILGENAQAWEFISKKIVMVDEGIWIGDEEMRTGILIGGTNGDRLSFLTEGTEVSYMSDRMMQILHGIFVESAIIADYKFEKISGTDILSISFVGEED